MDCLSGMVVALGACGDHEAASAADATRRVYV